MLGKILEGPVDMWREKPTPKEVCWQDLWLCGEPTLEQSEELFPMEGIHAGTAHEELQPRGRTHIGEICRRLSPVGEAPYQSRGRV